MEDLDVGYVLVCLDGRPAGIVTDRDLVLRVVCRGLDPSRTTAEEVMSAPVVTLAEGSEANDAASLMRERQVRRLPLVDRSGAVVGILTFDDLVHHVSRAEAELAEVISTYPVPHHGG
jgi:CBS domain-containing protein